MGFNSLPDITGTGVTIPITGGYTPCIWFNVYAFSSNAAVVRIGDKNTNVGLSAPEGFPIPASGSWFSPPNGNAYNYDLGNVYVYIGAGDKISVIYG